MKHILVGMILLTCLARPAFADDKVLTLGDREPVWTAAALGNYPSAALAANQYQFEWQRQLLAFQLSYSSELADFPDIIETGSITEGE